MSSKSQNDRQFPLLEALLGVSVLALVLQLLPAGWYEALDFRTWRRSTWMIINAIVITALLTSRYGAELVANWSGGSAGKSQIDAAKQMQQDRKERNEAIRRARDARKRRLYL
jgi:hypothetical protein